MRNKCLLGLGLVLVISLTSMVAFAFSFMGTPADEVDETEIIMRAAVSEEAGVIPTTVPIATADPEQETEKIEQSKIGSMDWDSDDAYMLAKIAMAEAESEDTKGKALVMLVVMNRVWDDEFPDSIEEVIFQKGQFSPISNGRYDKVEPDEDCYRALQLITDGWDKSRGATYFESKSDSTWHSENLTFLFKHGKRLTIYLIHWRNWKMKEIVEKKEVEELLGCEITDEQFEEALKYARHKQEYIYQREHRQVVLQHWYLVKLTEEYVRSLAFSKFTMDLCRTLQDMEKEHPIINQSAPTNNHIVAVSAL